ncbi:MAG: MCE family protein [Proteobacteria bacterium]|nr:MCE family protein [Pseudomonadota bacterium]MBU1745134.1 MCE family protein [Pseudomonadota bacterium]
MFSLSSEAKVGLFVLVALIILGYMSVQVGKQSFGLKKGYTLEVLFDSAAGLDQDASVQIAGVEIGRVESIHLKEGKALVRLRIVPNVKLEKDAIASIKTHGILGEKYVEIYPGTHGEAYLATGEQISRTEKQADIDKLLHQLGMIADDVRGVTSSLNRVLAGREGEEAITSILTNTKDLTRNLNRVIVSNEAILHAALENTRQLTGNLNRVVTQNDEKVGQVLDTLKSASIEMEKTFAALNEITGGINRGEGTIGQLVKDKGTADKLNQTLASLQEVSQKINEGRGSIGKLVNDDETVRNLNEGLTGLNRYVNKAEQFRTFLSYRGEYLFNKSDAKSYLDLRIQPKEDKFYILGVVSDPRGRRTTKDVTTGGVTKRTEEWDRDGLLFNAQIGKRYKDLVLRGGLLESTGGIGIDYLTLNDKLKLSFEAFGFGADRRAHLKAGAEYQLFRHVYLSAGWDDFVSDQDNRSIYGGFAIRFEDDDLKYMLTTTPIPK